MVFLGPFLRCIMITWVLTGCSVHWAASCVYRNQSVAMSNLFSASVLRHEIFNKSVAPSYLRTSLLSFPCVCPHVIPLGLAIHYVGHVPQDLVQRSVTISFCHAWAVGLPVWSNFIISNWPLLTHVRLYLFDVCRFCSNRGFTVWSC